MSKGSRIYDSRPREKTQRPAKLMGWKTWKGWVSFWRTTWSAGHETESVNLKYSPEDEVLKRTLTARFVGSMFVAKGNHKSMDWFCRWASLSRDVAWRQMKLSNFGFLDPQTCLTSRLSDNPWHHQHMKNPTRRSSQALGILWILPDTLKLSSIAHPKKGVSINCGPKTGLWLVVSTYPKISSDGKAYHLHVHRVPWWI
jgi:hypothetical protein